MLGFAGRNNAPSAKPPCVRREPLQTAAILFINPADKPNSAAYTDIPGAKKTTRETKEESAMARILACVLMLASFTFAPAHAQQLDTSLSDKQIVANILKDCRELYVRAAGTCACADERTRNSPHCEKVLKDLPPSFKPFCSRKDVTLREVSMYRMQNEGFIDRRCSK